MVSDSIGLDVVSEAGEKIGKWTDVQNYGATDILIIEQYKREYMVPYIKSIVKKVDISNNTIVINKQKYDEAKICD